VDKAQTRTPQPDTVEAIARQFVERFAVDQRLWRTPRRDEVDGMRWSELGLGDGRPVVWRSGARALVGEQLKARTESGIVRDGRSRGRRVTGVLADRGC
jgi:hypothetical protein